MNIGKRRHSWAPVKVRPHGQKVSRTTWYMVVRHKTCRGCGGVDGRGDVCRATF